ncbi:hypothetical protein ACFWAR_11155 [Streptomyces sp. NPDC059917]|uniref:hypothetical protein n=1 Tax=Streptomyces sp. NPDC059917 TaxID=3347002 RepID=UPI003667B93D
MTRNSRPGKRPARAAACVPLFVIAGLLLGPAATATAAVPTARQASAVAALPHTAPASGTGATTGVRASVPTRVEAVTGTKKSKKSKKKGGLFKKLLIGLVVVIVLLVILYGVRRALRSRSS